MAHSPAPWTWHIDEADMYDMGRLKSGDGNEVMYFGDATNYYPTEGTPPNDADKALICAAPDLLDACKLALSVISELDHIYSDRQKEAEQKLAEAIAKATNPIQTT